MQLSSAIITHPGKLREKNEDNFYFFGTTINDIKKDRYFASSKIRTSNELSLFAVFDGMGGEAAGERASQFTADTYAQKLQEMIDGDFSPEVVQNTIEEANKRVCDQIRVIGKRMGCTFVSVGFKNDNLYISNVGDSRAYILRNGILHCVSKDHTAAQTMVDAGLVSYEDSQKIKEKHQLTQHIGIFPEEMVIEPNYNSLKANSGDIVMICSDGLTDMLSDADIAAILSDGGTEQELTNALVEQALANGGKDNVTVSDDSGNYGVTRD
jgi:protein phosphatase